MSLNEQVIIIGGGPAGAACAIQLKRLGIDALLLEKNSIGGLIKNAWRLDNYPGYPEGIGGGELAEKIQKHVTRFEIRNQSTEIRDLKYSDIGFVLEGDKESFKCEYLVIATGTKPKHAFMEIPEEHRGKVYYEVFPLRGVKDKTIDIVGAGDAAFDYAMTLSSNNKVNILNRGTVIKCIPALLEIAQKHPNISYHENSKPTFSSDYTIFAVGREPELSFLSQELINKEEQLEQDGLLYVIGDVKNGMVRQASVAIGDGIKAAMAIWAKMISG